MKFFVFAFAVLFASVNAVPQTTSERFVDGIVAGVIEDLSQDIKDMGLDPLDIAKDTLQFKLPVTDILILQAHIENLLVEGLSNIVINSISFSLITTRLNFDISLPLISAQIGNINGEANVFDYEADAQIAGSLVITQPRVVGEVRINIGIISGISVRSVTIDLTIENIKSDLNVVILGNNFSSLVNDFLGGTIPRILTEFREDINRILEHYVKEAIEDAL